MENKLKPQGPIYLECLYEIQVAGAAQVETAYIDGFASKNDALKACAGFAGGSVKATNRDGESIAVDSSQIVQILLAQTKAQYYFPAAALAR